MTIQWSLLTTKKEARCLQNFTCMAPARRADRPWEHRAQAALRHCGQHLPAASFLLLGREDGLDVAVCLLDAIAADDTLEVFVYCAAVSLENRHRGGGTANRLMARVLHECCLRARGAGCRTLAVRGKIHRENLASQLLAKRFALEPQPDYDDEYQIWGRTVPVDASTQ